MATTVQIKDLAAGQAEKKIWTVPALQMIAINAALGARSGTKCDKFGSLSIGEGC
jgi:hypothetical protein